MSTEYQYLDTAEFEDLDYTQRLFEHVPVVSTVTKGLRIDSFEPFEHEAQNITLETIEASGRTSTCVHIGNMDFLVEVVHSNVIIVHKDLPLAGQGKTLTKAMYDIVRRANQAALVLLSIPASRLGPDGVLLIDFLLSVHRAGATIQPFDEQQMESALEELEDYADMLESEIARAEMERQGSIPWDQIKRSVGT